MSNIPPDFVAFEPGWQRAMRFERLSANCWIERSWHGKWVNPIERSEACVVEFYKKADLIMVPQEFEKTKLFGRCHI